METTRRGAAAALFALSVGAPLGAQAVGAGQVRIREPRDSTEFHVVMTKARLDSIATLMRQLNGLTPGSPEFDALRVRVEALMPRLKSLSPAGRAGGVSPTIAKGWIGILTQGPNYEVVGPNGHFVQYFDYPSIISVDPESPAQRAGIVPGDVLLSYDGVDVKAHRLDLTQILVPDKKLAVSVRHDGEAKDYVVTVAPAPAPVQDRRLDGRAEIHVLQREITSGDGPRAMVFTNPSVAAGGVGGARAGALVPFRTYWLSPNGAFGAVMSTVSPELAKTLKLQTGVLINDITDETPASKAGLRTGDVIVNVAGQPVSTLRALQEILAMHGAERSVALQIVRDKRPQTINVSW